MNAPAWCAPFSADAVARGRNAVAGPDNAVLVSVDGDLDAVTLPGYDNMTGLGTPDGPRFSQHLRELARS